MARTMCSERPTPMIEKESRGGGSPENQSVPSSSTSPSSQTAAHVCHLQQLQQQSNVPAAPLHAFLAEDANRFHVQTPARSVLLLHTTISEQT